MLIFQKPRSFTLVLCSFSEPPQNDKPQNSEYELKKTTNQVKLRRKAIREQAKSSPQAQTSHKNNI